MLWQSETQSNHLAKQKEHRKNETKEFDGHTIVTAAESTAECALQALFYRITDTV